MRITIRFRLPSVLFVTLALPAIPLAAQTSPESALRRALQTKTGVATLPGGVIEISREIVLAPDAHDLDIRGAATTIKASAAFRGRALLVLQGGKNIKLHDLSLDGNREAFAEPVAATPGTSVVSRLVANNGLLAEGVNGLEITKVEAKHVAGFPLLIDGGHDIHIRDVEIAECGSLDAGGHNNGSGGILLEEGVTDFEIVHALIGDVRGNGIWIRSADATTKAVRGRIVDSEFAILARAAIEVNHATAITIENNTGHMIGFPGDAVLIMGTSVPAAIVTTGAVDHAIIRNNNFEQLAGRCQTLDGLSDSEVNGNVCTGGLFNGFYVRGTGNRITNNHLTDLNNARREQPEALTTGIYLAVGASGNTLEGNEIAGYGMERRCIAGPGLAANKAAKNACSGGASLALLQPGSAARGQPAEQR